MAWYEVCPVCEVKTGQLKRHLIKEHGWAYTDESPNEPQPPSKGEIEG